MWHFQMLILRLTLFIYLFFLKANFKFNNNFYNYNDNIIGTEVQIGCMELTLNFSLKTVLLLLVIHNSTNKTYQKHTNLTRGDLVSKKVQA